MSEEEKTFVLEGAMKFELEIGEKYFKYRSQVSNENNLANLISVRELTAHMIKRQKSPALPKSEKVSKKELEMIITTNRLTSMYAERLAAAIYKTAKEKNLQPDKPKIEVVQPIANLKKV